MIMNMICRSNKYYILLLLFGGLLLGWGIYLQMKTQVTACRETVFFNSAASSVGHSLREINLPFNSGIRSIDLEFDFFFHEIPLPPHRRTVSLLRLIGTEDMIQLAIECNNSLSVTTVSSRFEVNRTQIVAAVHAEQLYRVRVKTVDGNISVALTSLSEQNKTLLKIADTKTFLFFAPPRVGIFVGNHAPPLFDGSVKNLQCQITTGNYSNLGNLLFWLGLVLIVAFLLRYWTALLPGEFLAVAIILPIGMLLMLLYCSVWSLIYHDFPYYHFFAAPIYRFSDFVTHLNMSRNLTPYFSNVVGEPDYLPLAYLLFWPAARLSDFTGSMPVYGLSLSTFLLFTVFFLNHLWTPALPDRGSRYFVIAAVISGSYPLWHAVIRGNTETLIFAAVAGAVWLYKARHEYWAALLLSVPIAVKITPSVFILLFLADRRYRLAAATLLLAVLSTIGALFCIRPTPSENISAILRWQQGCVQHFVLDHFDIKGFSFLTPFKFLLRPFFPVSVILKLYLPLVLAAAAVLTWAAVFRRQPFWKQLTLMTVMFLGLSFYNPFYRGVMLFLPSAYFLARTERQPGDRIYLTFFILLLVPKIYPSIPETLRLSLDPLLLLALGVILVAEGPLFRLLGITEPDDSPRNKSWPCRR